MAQSPHSMQIAVARKLMLKCTLFFKQVFTFSFSFKSRPVRFGRRKKRFFYQSSSVRIEHKA